MNPLDVGENSEVADKKPAVKTGAAPIVVSSDSAPAKLWKMISLFLVIISTALLVAFVLALVLDPCQNKEEDDDNKNDVLLENKTFAALMDASSDDETALKAICGKVGFLNS